MNRASAVLLACAALLIVAGVARWTVPGALIVAGFLAGGSGVLMLERGEPREESTR